MSLALWIIKKMPEVLNFIVLAKPKRCLSLENLIGETYHHICFEECRCVFRLIERFMSLFRFNIQHYRNSLERKNKSIQLKKKEKTFKIILYLIIQQEPPNIIIISPR